MLGYSTLLYRSVLYTVLSRGPELPGVYYNGLQLDSSKPLQYMSHPRKMSGHLYCSVSCCALKMTYCRFVSLLEVTLFSLFQLVVCNYSLVNFSGSSLILMPCTSCDWNLANLNNHGPEGVQISEMFWISEMHTVLTSTL